MILTTKKTQRIIVGKYVAFLKLKMPNPSIKRDVLKHAPYVIR